MNPLLLLLALVSAGPSMTRPFTPATTDTSGAAREWLGRWQGTFPKLAWGAFAPEGEWHAEILPEPDARVASDWADVSTIRWSPGRSRALYWCPCKEEVKEVRLAGLPDSASTMVRSYGPRRTAFDAFWPSESVCVLTYLRSEGKPGSERLVLEAFDLARRRTRTWAGPSARPPR